MNTLIKSLYKNKQFLNLKFGFSHPLYKITAIKKNNDKYEVEVCYLENKHSNTLTNVNLKIENNKFYFNSSKYNIFK